MAARFLRSFGFAKSVRGNHVALPSGKSVALSSIRTYDQLLRLTIELPRAKSFKGIGGLSSEHPAMKVVLRNLDKALPGGSFERAERALVDGKLVAAHDAAAGLLKPGARDLATTERELAKVYAAAGMPRAAELFARKLEHLQPGSTRARLLMVSLAGAEGRVDRAERSIRKLYGEQPDNPDVVAAYARLLVNGLDRPAEALAMARRAVKLDPKAAYLHTLLGGAMRYAASLDQYKTRDGKKASTAIGFREALRQYRIGQRLDPDYRIQGDMVLPNEQLLAKTEPLVAAASRAYDAGKLDRAAAVAKRAIGIDRDAALAYNVLDAVYAKRVADAREVLMGEQFGPPALQSRAARQRLVAKAKALGIDKLVRDFDRQPALRQAVIANSLLPMRAQWPRLFDGKRQMVVLPLSGTLNDLWGMRRDAKTFDGRYWYGTRGGAGEDLAVVGAESVGSVMSGSYDTFGHEFAHLVHHNLSAKRQDRIERLFKRGHALDDYAANNPFEYFAQGYEASLALRKVPGLDTVSDNTLAELKKKDPELLKEIRAVERGAR